MATLSKAAYIDKGNLTRVNRLLKRQGWPETEANYVSNIMERLGGADRSQQQQVYEIISVALNYDLIDSEGYPYTPSWM